MLVVHFYLDPIPVRLSISDNRILSNKVLQLLVQEGSMRVTELQKCSAACCVAVCV